jgi:type I restriction enzyme S subunit
VDELIAAAQRRTTKNRRLKVERALKTHKKGLMQQLFPREGETQPRLRFPEFQNAGEWDEKKLEHLAKRGSGHTPSKSHPEYYNGGIKWVSLADSKRLDNGFRVPTLAEQQTIAECLNSLDNFITAEIQKLETLKNHKKGLMQRLFPSLEELES